MVSKCANSQCSTAFHYLRGGRLYRFDLHHPTKPCADVPNAICAQNPSHASVYFWLCHECAARYTLRFSSRDGVGTLPLQAPLPVGVPLVVRVADAE